MCAKTNNCCKVMVQENSIARSTKDVLADTSQRESLNPEETTWAISVMRLGAEHSNITLIASLHSINVIN